MIRLLVTGANGFVGRAVCRLALARGYSVTGLVRRPGVCIPGVREWVHDIPGFDGLINAWTANREVDCVIHLAGQVHAMRNQSDERDTAFEASNIAATLRVAKAARAFGASRFVFASSIKAVAERDVGVPLTERCTAAPEDAYGRSKACAEERLMELGGSAGLDIVIVRPPVVYGPWVRANILRMMDAVACGMPLPLAAAHARRSVIFVDNFADALLCCATDPRAQGECFHVADDDAPSIADLLRMTGDALGKPARLFSLPAGGLRMLRFLPGCSGAIQRVTNSLQLDTSHIKNVLAWHPHYTTRQGLDLTAEWYWSTVARK
ncbi:NAD-dependent dehydratase [Burkholderia sp. Nafp2/4-1b]|uniref:NAD-dependent epimerase/dehydratase family protein n=1 Tax=Burkholderia sp. Nafp2/4-1b TaxID=2116686 RepID=UPI000EF8F5A2|nr:NAD-dependent epimerase/dehydratase family protein [Burkholderia sp. Nafp2/4-1b]RKT98704.1 NAD-dependent dehydratase [Burkholderia sp. Nafp2/4-1b]